MKRFLSLFAWYGVFAILLAYFLSIFKFLTVSSPLYLFLNLTGSLGVFIDSLYDADYQPAVLNIIWFSIALISLIRYILVS